jgi:hypothetical protein
LSGHRVAEPGAAQHLAEQEFLLARRAVAQHDVEELVVVLRDLADRPVGGGDDREHLGDRAPAEARAAVRGRHEEGQQPGGREVSQLGGGQRAVPVPRDRAGRDRGRVAVGGRDGVGRRADDGGRGSRGRGHEVLVPVVPGSAQYCPSSAEISHFS